MCYCVEEVACTKPWCKKARRKQRCRYPCLLNPTGDDAVARACSNFSPGLHEDAVVAWPSQECSDCALKVRQPAVSGSNNDGAGGEGAQGTQQQQQQEEEDAAMIFDPQPNLIIQEQGVLTLYGWMQRMGMSIEVIPLRFPVARLCPSC